MSETRGAHDPPVEGDSRMAWRRTVGAAVVAVVGTVALLGYAAAGAVPLRAPSTALATPAPAAQPRDELVFRRATEGETRLMLVRGDGRGLRTLLRNTSGGDETPAWSPDGRRLAFTRRSGGRLFVHVVGADGSGLRRVSPRAGVFAQAPTWSADGRWIAFAGSGGAFGECRLNVFVVRPDGSGLHRLLGGRDDELTQPAWSPDGTRLALVRVEGERRTILVGTAEGKKLRTLVRGSDPAWSPDSRHIAFVRQSGGTNRIHLVRSAGGPPRLLTSRRVYELDPAWSPDGRWVAYWSTAAGEQAVYASRVADGRTVRLTHPPKAAGDDAPAWRPRAGTRP
jgi:Tol biopolymer transport system component